MATRLRRVRSARRPRSAGSDERMSIVARACPGTVLAASPPLTVVITEVISGRPCASASIRVISPASAETALRPRAVSAPACAGRPVSSSVRHTAPLRDETRSPFSRAHSNTSAACGVDSHARATAGARSRTSSSAHTSSRTSGNGRPSGSQLLHRHGGQHQAALHVGDSRTGRAISRHRERTGQRLAQPKHRIGVTEQRHRLSESCRAA